MYPAMALLYMRFADISQQAKWDVKDLHRHPDYVPIKKEPPQQKPASEDDDLPPPRVNLGSKNESVDGSAAFDGDGEFGSEYNDYLFSNILKCLRML